MKIVPAIDLMNGQVVRLYKGDPSKKTIYSDNPTEIAKKWEKNGADMIHVVDIDATLGKNSNFEKIKDIINEVAIPIQIAGGLRSEELILKALDIAQRIVLGTIAFNNKKILKKLLESFDKNRIVISVDHVDGTIVVNGWQNKIGINVIDALKNFIDMGFSEFLLTNVSRDGTLEGPDIEYLQNATKIKNSNIISSGGISKIEDILEVKKCNAWGVILGKALYENKISIEEAKKIA